MPADFRHLRLPAMCRSPRRIDTIVVGAGHAGLAMSHELTTRGVEHVVLEAGDVGERWRNERWDSLTLLTPNWTLNLPGRKYDGDAPDAYMHKDVLAEYLARYAALERAPVKRFSPVHAVRACGDGYRVWTTQGEWRCRALVIATGAFAEAAVPAVAEALPEGVQQLTVRDYRRPDDVAPGRVMVVGGSATGLQFAHELCEAGRDVVLSVGEHVRVPRSIAGRDLYWWLMHSGVFWETTQDVDDIRRARRLPSPQLVGKPGADLNLNRLHACGAEIVGRFVGVSGLQAQFSGNLPNLCKSADLKMRRLLERFNEMPGVTLSPADLDVPPTVLPKPRLQAPFGPGGITAVLWATGYKPDYRWLTLDVLDRKGRLQHHEGVLNAPGVYAVGLPMLRTRASTFIAGAERDCHAVASHLHGYLNQTSHAAKRPALVGT